VKNPLNAKKIGTLLCKDSFEGAEKGNEKRAY
jgi:hypothetical protein